MENFGIDIGDHKTVLTGSSRNGRILIDELNKRTIQTQFQLSHPQRKFGNNVGGFKQQDMVERYRHFTNDQKLLTMYFCYLHRLILQNMDKQPVGFRPNVTISTRCTSLKAIDDVLMCARAADLNVVGVYDDLTCAAAHLSLKVKAHERFIMIDLGHAHSAIGSFTFVDGKMRARKIEQIEIGGGSFDERLFYHILEQCGLEKEQAKGDSGELRTSEKEQAKGDSGELRTLEKESVKSNGMYRGITVNRTNYRPCTYKETYKYLVLRETVIPKLKKYKMILSSTAVLEDTLEVGDDLYKIRINQDEYRAMIKDDIDRIGAFLRERIDEYIKDENHFCDYEGAIVEVVGGNSNNSFVREMLEQLRVKVRRSSDSHESVGFGAAIAGALPFYTTAMRVMDVLVGDVMLNGAVIFRDGALMEESVVVDRDGERVFWRLSRDAHEQDVAVEALEGSSSRDSSCDAHERNTRLSDQAPGGSSCSSRDAHEKNARSSVQAPTGSTLTFTHQGDVLLDEEIDTPFTAVLTRNKQLQIKGHNFETDCSHLLKLEEEFRQREIEIEQIGNLTNEYQLYLERLQNTMSKPIYYTLFTEDDLNNVCNLSMEFMYLPVCDTLKDEKKKIDEYNSKIDKFVTRMKDLMECKKKAVHDRIELSLKNLKGVKTCTPAVYKLQSRLNGNKDLLSRCTFDGDVEILNLERLDEEIVRMELEIEREVKEKEREKAEREEREKVAREKLRKAKEEKKGDDMTGNEADENKDEEQPLERNEKAKADEVVE
ncbi:Molecular chaperones HSP105/HSP110/SSE1, HSP70 superfamily [Trachipleistophora hominis]|uniref:Molecular chaperones HSP105/HSP110/SSE1, HSP70 superfamily n=1 Tax=Trachipleistophora hominis TaxID=72359 RepID=L7JR07_TRAHO|nr:Molecular chaperones HSP105/HSP110/SSE1, HSP70 superfamily [Trachipleistophora hominis]